MHARHLAGRSCTFALPGVLALVSGSGLILALLGEGWFDVFAWLALATPPAAVLFAVLRRRRR